MPTSRFLSVVMPAFNHERFVAEAVESVRLQSLSPEDFVVVDDGSTDGTAQILERVAYPGMTMVRQENRGAHAALNRAVAHAGGPWIAILNSDDVFAPYHLESALGVARTTGAALVIGRVHLVGEDGTPLSPYHPTALWYRKALAHRAACGSLAEALAHQNVAVTTSNFFFHKELWRRLGGFRPYRYVHDYDCLLRAVAAAPSRVVFEDTLDGVAYRVHGANTIAEDGDRAMAEREAMLRSNARLIARARSILSRPATRRALQASLDAEGGRPLRPSRPSPSTAPDGAIRCGLVVTDLDAGGLEEVVALLAAELPGKGLEPHVLCTRAGGRVATRLARSGVPVTVAATPRERLSWLDKARPQVLSTHFVDAEVLSELAGAGIPAVETVHNAYVWLSAEGWHREAEKQRWLKAVIAVSEGAAAYYRRHAGSACAPITVVSNGVVPERVCAVPRSFARRVLSLPPEGPVLTQLGRIAPQKNQVGLLAAFRDLAAQRPGAVLVLAGDASDPAYATRILAEFGDLSDSGQLRMGTVGPDVGTLLSASDAFVANSWFEGWSLGATEALWAGIPLVVSDCGGSREMVGTGGVRGRLVPNPGGDPLTLTLDTLANPPPHAAARNRAALTEAMLDVLDHPRMWSDRAPEIRAWARSRFSADRVAAGYAEVLRRALD